MLKFLRFICIWICCVSCLFGRITLPAVAAVPFEYIEDHEQLSYYLDTEQSKAKYDTRLLSEQLLKEQKSSTAQIYGEQRKNERSQEIIDDLQPHERAASCYKSGYKYTHGQKVPRLDPCEVCLCMDGEIFCWWEKCAKKRQKLAKISFSNHDSSILKFHNKRMRTTDRPLQRGEHEQQQASAYKVDGSAAAAVLDELQPMQYEEKFFKIKQKQKQHANKMAKKKMYQNAQQHLQQQQQPEKYTQQLNGEHQQHIHKHLHEHEHEHEHEHGHEHTSSSSSKILNFPENLPSVLYHDYNTDEHQHHQHQHRQQHLKHQLQQHQIQQLQQQQQHQMRQVKVQELQHGQHSMVMAPTTTTTTIEAAAAPAVETTARAATVTATTTTLATPLSSSYLSTFSDDNYDEIETDSDILPEPPTKKPKATATATATTVTKHMMTIEKPTTAAIATATVTSLVMTVKNNGISNNASDTQYNYNAAGVRAIYESVNDSDSSSNNNIGVHKIPSKINVAGGAANAATAAAMNDKSETNNRNNNKNIQDTTDEDDDAFHRWLTSTEINNNNSNNRNNDMDNFDATQGADLDMLLGIEQQPEEKDFHETTRTTAANKDSNEIMNLGILPQEDLHLTHTHTRAHTHTHNDDDVYFRSSYNDYSSEFNGTVVNIDILLTTADENQQQPQQPQQQHEHEHEEQQLVQHQQQHELQLQQETIKLEKDEKKRIDPIAKKSLDNKTDANAILASTAAATVNVTSLSASTSTLSPDKQCNVMGTLYRIGDILPQDTGNCLQCICIDGSTSDDTPRVTCSPHNCPPLVLPDLFDATGY